MNKLNLSVLLKAIFLVIAAFTFSSCGEDDDEVSLNDIIGKWHIASSSDKLIFFPDNTGLWIHGSENKVFTWRGSEASNAFDVWQKFPNNKTEWYLGFSKKECTENTLNGFYETYTNNEGYINGKRNSIIKLIRHTDGCAYGDYTNNSDWSNDDDNNDNDGSSDGNSGSSGDSGESPENKAETPEIGYYDSTPYTTKLKVMFKIYNQDRAKVNRVKGYYGTTSATKSASATLSGQMITLNISGLKKGTNYVVKVTASGPGGTASESTTLSTLY